jgi:hypothetical protein
VVEPLFGASDEGTCEAYRACRDHITKEPTRDALEAAWRRTWHLVADPEADLRAKFRQAFHPVAWEIYLRDVLVGAGIRLERPPSPDAPDVLARVGDQRVWIEAVTVGPGEAGSAERPRSGEPGPRVGTPFHVARLLSRIVASIAGALSRVEDWTSRGDSIAPGDVVLVALNHGQILDSDLHDEDVPAFVRALIGVGETVTIASVGGESPPIETRREPLGTAQSAAPVRARLFEEERSAVVSGVLVARQLVWNLRWDPTMDLALLHNPMAGRGARAAAPLAWNALPLRCEMAVEAGELRRRGRCNRFVPYGDEAWEALPPERPSAAARQARQRELERIARMPPRERALLALRLGRGR